MTAEGQAAPVRESTFSPGSFLTNLNPPQRKGVTHFKGPILVLAGAGSGKTRVLTRRVAYLVAEKKVRPDQILAVTFTNKAAGEMKERLRSLLGARAQQLWISTFHSAALRILRRHASLLGYQPGFTVYDAQDSKNLLKRVLKDMGVGDKKESPASFMSIIDRAKNDGISPESYAEGARDYFSLSAAEVYDRYQKALRESNAMDFGDLLLNALELMQSHQEVLAAYQQGLQFLLVDEFQDTNIVQYELLRLLAEKHKNLFVVGDDDQSIYSFRGATVHNIARFEKDFSERKLIKLEQNYRSTGNILDSAHAVIEKNESRKEKRLWTASGEGAPVYTCVAETELEEAQFIAEKALTHIQKGGSPNDIAVFYRTNAQSRAIEEAFVKQEVPYRIYGGLKFYERKEIKDILGYLRLLAFEGDVEAFVRVVNTPPRGIGAKTLQTLRGTAAEQRVSLLEACRFVGQSNKKVHAFIQMFDELNAIKEDVNLAELVRRIIELSGYRKLLQETNDPSAQSRLENLDELVAIASQSDVSQAGGTAKQLQEFLDRIALATGGDVSEQGGDGEKRLVTSDEQAPPPAVSLMTLHLAKGLEFPLVFLTGLEEGLLPHHRSVNSPLEVEEERRLCYVGMTRAEETLYLTRANQRGMFSAGGGFAFSGNLRLPSRFAFDIPDELLADLHGSFKECFEPAEDSFFDDDEDDAWEHPLDEAWSKQKTAKPTESASSAVKSAEVLAAEHGSLPRLAPSQIQQGMHVRHLSFGAGEVKEVQGDLGGDLRKVRVLVDFENYSVPKRLVLKFAKLYPG